MAEPLFLVLQGPLGALILVAWAVLLIARELLLFTTRPNLKRVGVFTGRIAVLLAFLVLAQVVSRILW